MIFEFSHSDINNTYKDNNLCFFAIQVAIATYPGDPLRTYIHDTIVAISDLDDQAQRNNMLKELLRKLYQSLRFMEYCVWDYSLNHDISLKEYKSWLYGLRSSYEEDDINDSTGFQETQNTYFVFTLVLNSEHYSLRNWVEYYPNATLGDEVFKRTTIEILLKQFSKQDSSILSKCTQGVCAVMPNNIDRYYTYEHFKTSEWKYLKPIY